MPLYKTKAIVLKNKNLGEADKIVVFFTEKFGKISGVAKGARKIKSRFCGNIELLTFCNLFYFGKENQNLYKINSCSTIKSFTGIKEDLVKISIAMCVADLSNSMLKDLYVSSKVFHLIIQTLTCIETANEPEALLRLFEIRFMSLLGYMPRLERCISCNNEPENGTIAFDFSKRGVVCRKCVLDNQNKIMFNPGTLKFLNKAITIDLDKVGRLKIPKGTEKEISTFTQSYIRLYTNRQLKAYSFMNRILKE